MKNQDNRFKDIADLRQNDEALLLELAPLLRKTTLAELECNKYLLYYPVGVMPAFVYSGRRDTYWRPRNK